jgi:Dynamin family
MSATGTWVVPTRAFEASLTELKTWRQSVASELAAFRRWALVSRLMDEQTVARLAHLERRLAVERLTVAFVAEYSRGKSELINALFFAELGRRLLPSGTGRTTLCPAEILWDPARPPSIRLLPIESRESPKALREFMNEPSEWHEIALDPSQPEAVAAACRSLSEAITISGIDAAGLGFDPGSHEFVELPRWRYAVVNLPHPLLESGLTILDTPGRAALAAEPELTLHRVPDAAAIVFMVGADTGLTADDQALWNEHIGPIDGLEQTCFVALNKIDALRDPGKPESQVLAEIDRQVRATADALRIAPTRVFALSAQQGLEAKLSGDRDGLIRSRLYRLEQALAKGMVHQRRIDHASVVLAETRSAFAESRSLIESRIAFTRSQLEELAALQGKNQKLVETLARKAAGERSRLEKARAEMAGLRGIHNRHGDELARLLDPAHARETGLKVRAEIVNTRFSGHIGQVLDGYFQAERDKLEHAIKVIGEVRSLMAEAKRKFAAEYGVTSETLAEFATERFLVELARLEEHCDRDFKSTTSLLTRGRKTLAALFFDTVATQVIRVFEIADREVRTWMNGFIRPLEAQLSAFQEQTNARIEGMGRIQNAETDLVARLDELQALLAEVEAQRGQCEAQRERLSGLLEVSREHSLA